VVAPAPKLTNLQIFRINNPDAKIPESAMEKSAAKNWESFFCEKRDPGNEWVFFLVADREAILAGIKCFLDLLDGGDTDCATVVRLEILTFLLKDTNFDYVKVLEGAFNYHPTNCGAAKTAMSDMINSLIFGSIDKFTGEYAICAKKVIEMRAINTLRLVELLMSLRTNTFKLDISGNQHETRWSSVVFPNGMISDTYTLPAPDTALDIVIRCMAFERMFNESEAFRALCVIGQSCGGSLSLLIATDNDVLQQIDEYGMPKYVYFCRKTVELTQDIVLQLLISANNCCSRANYYGPGDIIHDDYSAMCRAAIEMLEGVAARKWPSSTLEAYTWGFADCPYVAETIKDNPTLLLPEQQVSYRGIAMDFKTWFSTSWDGQSNSLGVNGENIGRAVRWLLDNCGGDRTGKLKYRLTAAIFVLKNRFVRPLKSIFGDALFNEFRQFYRGDELSTAAGILNEFSDFDPWFAENRSELVGRIYADLLRGPKELMDEVASSLSVKVTISYDGMYKQFDIKTMRGRPSIVKFACARADRELYDESEVFRALRFLHAFEMFSDLPNPICDIGSNGQEMQQLDDKNEFPKHIFVTYGGFTRWEDLTAEMLNAMINAATKKIDNLCRLSMFHWRDETVVGCGHMLSIVRKAYGVKYLKWCMT
jgi:hypothetical protein